MFETPPSWPLCLLFLAPNWLYRLGLGPLLGHRVLLLTHRGRKSGRIYRTVLEVAHYDPRTRESIVGSGWGTRADWYRNIRANPPLEVQTGGDRYVPTFRELSQEDNFGIVEDYMRRLPPFARPLAYRLGLDAEGSEAERRAHAARLLLIGFRPRRGPARSWPRLRP
jgi:deazaflavin-dependent oxidoreductase (nitroreductase family)